MTSVVNGVDEATTDGGKGEGRGERPILQRRKQRICKRATSEEREKKARRRPHKRAVTWEPNEGALKGRPGPKGKGKRG